jgi:ribonuclease-3
MVGGSTVERLEDAIGHRFADPSLVTTALTHSSYAAENDDAESYERLEFLGDAVLELVATDLVFGAMPNHAEGDMTKIRASIVDETTLAALARGWGLDEAARLGVGEERSGGRDRDSILSDLVEALLAAVYLDGGYDAAHAVIRTHWMPLVEDRIALPDVSDPRSRLQETLARSGREVIFTYARSGPDHAAVFTASAIVDGDVIGEGSGGSKKTAAIAAASDALDRDA